jgi:hypothetical protein
VPHARVARARASTSRRSAEAPLQDLCGDPLGHHRGRRGVVCRDRVIGPDGVIPALLLISNLRRPPTCQPRTCPRIRSATDSPITPSSPRQRLRGDALDNGSMCPLCLFSSEVGFVSPVVCPQYGLQTRHFVRFGSWLRENAGVLQRRRMASSPVRWSPRLARGLPAEAHGGGVQKSRKFGRPFTFRPPLTSWLSCVSSRG